MLHVKSTPIVPQCCLRLFRNVVGRARKGSGTSFFGRFLFVFTTLLLTGCVTQTTLTDTVIPILTTVDQSLGSQNLAGSTIIDPNAALQQNVCLVPAFPSAEGFGAFAKGGRGGRVIEVINLNNEGPGSLREAVRAKGPRIVIFRVGGTIELESHLNIAEPYLTIAGQTATGGGITLKGKGITKDPLQISTHDIVIRYLRVRSGPGGDSGAVSIAGGDTYNVILDHVSVSWGVDENLTTWYDNHDITIQWSVIAEGLSNSTHSEGEHSKGLMLGSKGSYNLSVHHNLLAHNVERNPRIQTEGLVDFTNNVIYNYEVAAGWITNDRGSLTVNYIGNFIKPGPNSDPERYELEIDQRENKGNISVYVEGNIGPHRADNNQPEENVVEPNGRQFLSTLPRSPTFVKVTSAEEAYQQVLADAGATVPARDAVDQRIVQDVINGTGQIIDDPAQVGGWPEIANGDAPADTDHDGMPDEWEKQYGLDGNLTADGNNDADEDGYTNVEEYLNNTHPLEENVNPLEGCLFLPVIHR